MMTTMIKSITRRGISAMTAASRERASGTGSEKPLRMQTNTRRAHHLEQVGCNKRPPNRSFESGESCAAA